jgi:hypothetical protein
MAPDQSFDRIDFHTNPQRSQRGTLWVSYDAREWEVYKADLSRGDAYSIGAGIRHEARGKYRRTVGLTFEPAGFDPNELTNLVRELAPHGAFARWLASMFDQPVAFDIALTSALGGNVDAARRLINAAIRAGWIIARNVGYELPDWRSRTRKEAREFCKWPQIKGAA